MLGVLAGVTGADVAAFVAAGLVRAAVASAVAAALTGAARRGRLRAVPVLAGLVALEEAEGADGTDGADVVSAPVPVAVFAVLFIVLFVVLDDVLPEAVLPVLAELVLLELVLLEGRLVGIVAPASTPEPAGTPERLREDSSERVGLVVLRPAAALTRGRRGLARTLSPVAGDTVPVPSAESVARVR